MGPRRTALVTGAEPAGAEECGVCHDEVQGHERISEYHRGCESCHGAGSLHADSEEPEQIRYPSNADCLVCHVPGYDTHLQWGTGDHSRADLFCSDCHNPHATTRQHLRPGPASAFPDMDAASKLCVSCHRDKAAAQTLPSHHPVAEGALSCLSCHDPHEDSRTQAGDANHVCKSCHQDLIGPWIYEHPPVVEACSLCHDPHGAPSDNLLPLAPRRLGHRPDRQPHHQPGSPDRSGPADLGCRSRHLPAPLHRLPRRHPRVIHG
jgi:DmsE family decaheme c-type cytochrome